jgi:hypothetical protein
MTLQALFEFLGVDVFRNSQWDFNIAWPWITTAAMGEARSVVQD